MVQDNTGNGGERNSGEHSSSKANDAAGEISQQPLMSARDRFFADSPGFKRPEDELGAVQDSGSRGARPRLPRIAWQRETPSEPKLPRKTQKNRPGSRGARSWGSLLGGKLGSASAGFDRNRPGNDGGPKDGSSNQRPSNGRPDNGEPSKDRPSKDRPSKDRPRGWPLSSEARRGEARRGDGRGGRRPNGKPRRRSSISTRADKTLKWSFGGLTMSVQLLVALVVVGVIIVAVVPTAFQWLQQERAYKSAVSDVELQREYNEELQEQLEDWEDEDFVTAQARERLGYVREGETQFVVIDPAEPKDEDEHNDKDTLAPPKPWPWALLEAVQDADHPPPSDKFASDWGTGASGNVKNDQSDQGETPPEESTQGEEGE